MESPKKRPTTTANSDCPLGTLEEGSLRQVLLRTCGSDQEAPRNTCPGLSRDLDSDPFHRERIQNCEAVTDDLQNVSCHFFDTKERPRVAPVKEAIDNHPYNLMDESGKMLEYLRKEVFRLRTQNTQIRTDFDLLKDNNQRVMDANATAGASFAALNHHTKQLSRANDKIRAELDQYKQQVQKLNVTQVELREELRMKQATYIAEVQSRLQYQKALSKIVDISQDRCRDTKLVEDILKVADECEAEYMSEEGTTPFGSPPDFETPRQEEGPSHKESSGLMGSIRSFWS
jgi:hypothetical protein